MLELSISEASIVDSSYAPWTRWTIFNTLFNTIYLEEPVVVWNLFGSYVYHLGIDYYAHKIQY